MHIYRSIIYNAKKQDIPLIYRRKTEDIYMKRFLRMKVCYVILNVEIGKAREAAYP